MKINLHDLGLSKFFNMIPKFKWKKKDKLTSKLQICLLQRASSRQF